MKRWISKSILTTAILALPLASTAEDIDLFLGPPTENNDAPNVLFVIDNTGNWTAPFEDEKDAFEAVFNAIRDRIEDANDDFAVNIGILMFAETGSPNNNTYGGYVRAAVRPMGAVADADQGTFYADLYSDLIQGFHERDDKANSGAAGLAMAEAYYYFSGGTPYAGNNKAKVDWGSAVSGSYNQYYNHSDPTQATCCAESHPVWALPGNALDTVSSTTYHSPIAEDSCGKNYIIWISNGPTQDPSAGGSDSIPKQKLDAALAAAGLDLDQYGAEIPLDNSGSQDTWADEWARFMYKSEQEITTFTVDVLPKDTGQGPGWTDLLESMADQSQGAYYLVDDPDAVASQLAGAINDALDRILAVNSVFASVALPAASNAQSTFLNQVFIGQFRPDKDAHPRWPGNLKQYKLGIVDGDLKLLDANGDGAVDNGTGFIEKCADSFWSTADSYWSGDLDLNLKDEEICSAATASSNAPDGPIVEKGGQAQQLRATVPANRTVYTCDSDMAICDSASASGGLTSFNTANTAITDTLLGVTSADRDDTINWGRGKDVDDEDNDSNTAEYRASVHGDVVHSRPVAINYGTNTQQKIVVFYSGNDGVLRAINGNRPDLTGPVNPASGVDEGEEIWAFMPPEFYSSIAILRDNSDIINFPASSVSAPTSGISKPYGVDGPITAFEGNVPAVSGTDKFRRYLFAGMRRTGRVVYAFDVTDISAPELLWKKGCPNLNDDTGCSSATSPYTWTGIGQTWSQANLIYAAGYVDATSGDGNPMLVMGGGYDSCEDTDNNSTVNNDCSSTKGNVIYVLDAHTGDILKTFSTDRAVAGGITVVRYSDDNPNAAWAYATDTGGNIYRISGADANTPFADTAPGSWTITKIASLGCDTAAGSCTANRKFLFGPDVVKSPVNTDKLTVLVGSGDREKPLVDYGAAHDVQNYFFSVVDTPTSATWLSDVNATCGANVICLSALTSVTTAGAADGVTLAEAGWRLPLAAGEQVVTGAITVSDIANFSTHTPAQPDDVCASSLGTARSYSLDYRYGDGDTVTIVKGGLVPTPVAGMVILDDGKKVPFCIGCGGEQSAIGAKLVGTGITWDQPKSRVYWNIQQ